LNQFFQDPSPPVAEKLCVSNGTPQFCQIGIYLSSGTIDGSIKFQKLGPHDASVPPRFCYKLKYHQSKLKQTSKLPSERCSLGPERWTGHWIAQTALLEIRSAHGGSEMPSFQYLVDEL
jgi:hypothetical protein